MSHVGYWFFMGLPEDVTAQIAEIRNELDSLLATVLAFCAERPVDDEASSTRLALENIKAKEFASVAEAAQLMRCSDSHVRNLVEKAIADRATYPIPFADLDGVRVFPVQELLLWTRIVKPRVKKRTAKKNREKSQLAAVES
jgi:hypothetical protein